MMIFYIELKKHVWKYVWKHVRKYGCRNIRSKNFLQFSYIFSPSNTDIYWEVHSVIENKIISFPAPFFLLLFHCHSKGRWTCVAYLVWSPLVSLAMPWNNSSPFPLPRGRLVCCQLLGEKRKIDTNPHLTGKCSFIEGFLKSAKLKKQRRVLVGAKQTRHASFPQPQWSHLHVD